MGQAQVVSNLVRDGLGHEVGAIAVGVTVDQSGRVRNVVRVAEDVKVGNAGDLATFWHVAAVGLLAAGDQSVGGVPGKGRLNLHAIQHNEPNEWGLNSMLKDRHSAGKASAGLATYRRHVVLERAEVFCNPLPYLFDHQLLGRVELAAVVVKGKGSSREGCPEAIVISGVAVKVKVELVASAWLGR